MDPIELPVGFDVKNIPATVITASDGRRALVFHPCGLAHENAASTIERLERRGVRVVNSPARAAA